MGTNYYYRTNDCSSCGRHDDIHVGKSSGGWSFGFRGYRHDPDDGFYSPTGFPVLSRADWRTVFTEKPGTLRDEYGRQVDNPVEWLDHLPAPDDAQIAKENQLTSGSYWRGGASTSERDWRDAEGFRFDDSDFS